ncbi:hypothetical protein [Xanthocytophaga agilis]|uniref:Uncharacterized protein n=1 Tax=Xanthocytophaga agilis TaxID=3048010 RepID=A0AAE3R519_9BACT|nr:hypothetical protein [Xanthocytophaga agilis]MDJ1501534.1 hypothetical protein [Xanthocytophaga agilis]
MIKKIVGYLFILVGTLGIILFIPLMYEGTRPCSGDGCIVQAAIFVGLFLLLLGGILLTIGIVMVKPKPKTSN